MNFQVLILSFGPRNTDKNTWPSRLDKSMLVQKDTVFLVLVKLGLTLVVYKASNSTAVDPQRAL